MIYYNSWLNTNARLSTIRAQNNANNAAAYYEVLRPLRHAIEATVSPLRLGWRLWRQRRHRKAAMLELSRLDDHMLKDIGISRSQIPGLALQVSRSQEPKPAKLLMLQRPQSSPAGKAAVETECQVIPLVQPDRKREVQFNRNGRRHRYPLPLNAA